MLIFVFAVIAAAGALAAVYRLAAAGFRNGDRPGDALVSAVLSTTGPATTGAVVRNPSGTPVLVGLTAGPARWPARLASPHAVSVPRWTLRGKFDPARYECVAVVPAGGAAEFAVPPCAAVLVVAVGQEGGRLRVHRLRLPPPGYLAEGRPTMTVP